MNDVLGPHTKEEKLRSLKEKYMMTTSLETMAAIIKKPSVSQWVDIQCRPGLLWTTVSPRDSITRELSPAPIANALFNVWVLS